MSKAHTNVLALNIYTQRSKLKMQDYCDPMADTPSEVAAAIEAAVADAIATGRVLEFEPGATYETNAAAGFLGAAHIRGLRFWGNGATIYRSSGAGPVATLDSGGATARCDDIEFMDFRLRGNASSTYALYARGLNRSRVGSLRAVDVATAGYLIEWAVCSSFKDVMMSNNLDTFTVTAAKGMVIDHSQSGYYTADCIFENAVMEGEDAISDVGIELVHADLSNVFRGGTCEGLARGFRSLSTSGRNTITEMDFEQNTVYDISIAGNGLTLQDVSSFSAGSSGSCIVAATARNTTFRGGFQRWVAIDPASLATRFYGTQISDNGSVGITGPASATIARGIHQAYGVVKVDTDLLPTAGYPDVYAPQQTWTPAYGTGGGAQGATTVAVGTYTVVGSICFVQGYLSIAKGTLSAGALTITGLPFGSRNVTNMFQFLDVGEWNNVALGAGYTNLTMSISPGTTVGVLIKSGVSVASSTVALADFPDPMVLKFSGSYEIEG